jgi:hypothetical protein
MRRERIRGAFAIARTPNGLDRRLPDVQSVNGHGFTVLAQIYWTILPRRFFVGRSALSLDENGSLYYSPSFASFPIL